MGRHANGRRQARRESLSASPRPSNSLVDVGGTGRRGQTEHRNARRPSGPAFARRSLQICARLARAPGESRPSPKLIHRAPRRIRAPSPFVMDRTARGVNANQAKRFTAAWAEGRPGIRPPGVESPEACAVVPSARPDVSNLFFGQLGSAGGPGGLPQ